MLTIDSRSKWIRELAGLSQTVATIAQAFPLAEVSYRDSVTGATMQSEALNFSNSAEHNAAFARCFDGLSRKGAHAKTLSKSLEALTSGRNTYGVVCELLTYLWLLDHNLPFQIQVPLSRADVLNQGEHELDGKLTDFLDVFFDVKAFGFQERLIERLRQRLEADMPGRWIAVEGSWDVSVRTLESLLSKQYKKLLLDLKQKHVVSRGVLHFIERDKKHFQISHHTMDPYLFAEENTGYVLSSADQFCTKSPFILFFAYHPWLGGNSLNTDFAGYACTVTRSLARRTFIKFLDDPTHVSDTLKEPRGVASRLVSGIGFLNVSQLPAQPGGRDTDPTLRLYLNPNATNPVSRLTIDLLQSEARQSVMVEDFSHDNY